MTPEQLECTIATTQHSRARRIEELGDNWGCCWAENKKCTEEATHWHFMFGELCPTHAATVMKLYPRDKVLRI